MTKKSKIKGRIIIETREDDNTGISVDFKRGVSDNDFMISLFNSYATFTSMVASYYKDKGVAKKILREAFDAGLKMSEEEDHS